MALAEESALSGLHHFLASTQSLQSLQRSPQKLPTMDDIMNTVLQHIPAFSYPTPIDAKPAGSSDSDTPRNQSPNSEAAIDTQPAPGSGRETRPYRQEPWHECFTTVNKKEFDALIYSLYVMARDDKKLDGYEYFECINRLQSKCRYRVRARRVNEFIIVEERGAHNHAMEPVGTPGTHAGLPKTLREIVDRSFYEDWSNAVRQEKLEEEVRRLGLPHNPRLGRQVDNRIAYLRRVKNLNEMKKIQDQVTPTANGEVISENERESNGMPGAISNGAFPTVENSTDLLQIMMQAGRLPELSADTQAQLMALMMGTSATSIQTENGTGKDELVPNPSMALAAPLATNQLALLANPFLHSSSSMANLLPLATANPMGHGSPIDEGVGSVDVDDDDDCGTEEHHLHSAAQH